jgi:biofilm PGA synthesis protein PgaA
LQQTPLRALRNGVSANRGEGWLRWYQNERREYRVSVAASRFTDHNRRQGTPSLVKSASGRRRG